MPTHTPAPPVPLTDWPHLPRRQTLAQPGQPTPGPRTTTLPPQHTTALPPGRTTAEPPPITRGLTPESRRVLWRTMSLGSNHRRLRLAALAHWAGHRQGYQTGYVEGWRSATVHWTLIGALGGATLTALAIELVRRFA